LAEEDSILAALDALTHACLLTDTGDHAYTFTHDLIREVVLADLTAARREAWHLRLGETLERLPEHARRRRAAELAWHFAEGQLPARALPYIFLAGNQAAEVHANDEAERQYQRAAEVARALGDRESEALALERLGVSLTTSARYESALQALEAAAHLYRALGDLTGERRAAAHLGRVHARRGSPEEGLARLRPLVEAAGDLPPADAAPTDGLAALYAALADLYCAGSRHVEQLAAAEQAARLATTAHDRSIHARAVSFQGSALLMLGRMEEGARVMEEAIRLTERVGDLWSLAHALNNTGVVFASCGDFDQERYYVERALETATRLGAPALMAFMRYRLGRNAYFRGVWDVAREHFELAFALIRQVGDSWFSSYPPFGLGQLCLACGEDGADVYLQRALDISERNGDLQALQLMHTALAERELVQGRPDLADARLAGLLTRAEAAQSDVSILLPPLAWASLELGDCERAATLLARGTAQATTDQNSFDLVDTLRIRSFMEIRLEHWQDAQQSLEDLLHRVRAMAYPYAEAKALYVYGQLHAAKGEPERARERYQAALAICERLGEGLYRPHIEHAVAALDAPPGDP
jgi:tetratricopeptide (TPR) repeat protein